MPQQNQAPVGRSNGSAMRIAVVDERCVDAAAAQLRVILARVDAVTSRFRCWLGQQRQRSGALVR